MNERQRVNVGTSCRCARTSSPHGGGGMSVLVVGLSHRSAPVDLLEQASLDTDAAVKLSHLALEVPAVTESAVISTCNRVEVYVEADRFHGSVEEVTQLLADQSGLRRDGPAAARLRPLRPGRRRAPVPRGLRPGLDDPGREPDPRPGARHAAAVAQAESTAGTSLNALFQQALRIGKRGHAETGIDRLAPSLVTAGLDAAGDRRRPRRRPASWSPAPAP